MKSYLLYFVGCIILYAPGALGQDVYQRFEANNGFLDFKISYVSNASSDFTGHNVSYRATYSKNYILLPGDGVKDPVIGFSLNPSVGYAIYTRDSVQAPYALMQDGVVSFVPSLYMKVLPESGSKFTFYAYASGGIKEFPGFDKLNPKYSPQDQNFSLHGQWVFDVGLGIDFNKKFSLFFKSSKGWNDFTASSRDYFRRHISSGATSQDYFNVRGNFRVNDYVTLFTDWSGYNNSFKNESMTNIGVAFKTFGQSGSDDRPSEAKINKAKERIVKLRGAIEKNASLFTKPGLEASALKTKLDHLDQRLDNAKDDQTYLEILKELNDLTKEVKSIERKPKWPWRRTKSEERKARNIK